MFKRIAKYWSFVYADFVYAANDYEWDWKFFIKVPVSIILSLIVILPLQIIGNKMVALSDWILDNTDFLRAKIRKNYGEKERKELRERLIKITVDKYGPR